jgi:hypothetical protein
MVCFPATSEAGARWSRFGLVVVATTNRRDNKVQMIRPIVAAQDKMYRMAANIGAVKYHRNAVSWCLV